MPWRTRQGAVECLLQLVHPGLKWDIPQPWKRREVTGKQNHWETTELHHLSSFIIIYHHFSSSIIIYHHLSHPGNMFNYLLKRISKNVTMGCYSNWDAGMSMGYHGNMSDDRFRYVTSKMFDERHRNPSWGPPLRFHYSRGNPKHK